MFHHTGIRPKVAWTNPLRGARCVRGILVDELLIEASENGWLEYDRFPLGMAYHFRGKLLVLGSVSPFRFTRWGYSFIPIYFVHEPIDFVEQFERRMI